MLPGSAALARHGGNWHVVERASVASDGGETNEGFSGAPAVSGDGSIVAFTSEADSLVPGDSNESEDVFVHNRVTGRTRRVSVASNGSQASGGNSSSAAVSGDGRIVAFWSAADNLVPRDSNGIVDVFVHNRATGRTGRVSVARDGSQAAGPSLGPALSGDGRTVAFQDTANLWCPATATATTTCSSRSGRRHRAARSPAPQATTC